LKWDELRKACDKIEEGNIRRILEGIPELKTLLGSKFPNFPNL
jgi:hypothetical protein